MTPEQQHHICTELARRMGWTTCSGGWIARDDRILPDPPDPFTSAEDNRALVAWLAAQDEIVRLNFDSALKVGAGYADYPFYSLRAHEALSLSRETITLAAARALGIETE